MTNELQNIKWKTVHAMILTTVIIDFRSSTFFSLHLMLLTHFGEAPEADILLTPIF